MPSGKGGEATALLTILGAGTCVPADSRHSAAHHLSVGSASLLLDCGPGTLHGFDTHGIAWEELTHVAISHYHTDHVGDLAALLHALEHCTRPKRTRPLSLIGPVGFTGFLRRLADALGDHVVRPSFGVRAVEISPGRTYLDPEVDFSLEARPTPHTAESVAYRVGGTWGALAYTGDTGPSPELSDLFRGSSVLVAECSHDDPPPTARHLSPDLLIDLARGAEPELLVVTHVYPPLTPGEAVRRIVRGYPGVTVAASDGMRVRIGSGGPVVEAR